MQDGRVGPWQTKATATYMITSSSSIKRNLQRPNKTHRKIRQKDSLRVIKALHFAIVQCVLRPKLDSTHNHNTVLKFRHNMLWFYRKHTWACNFSTTRCFGNGELAFWNGMYSPAYWLFYRQEAPSVHLCLELCQCSLSWHSAPVPRLC